MTSCFFWFFGLLIRPPSQKRAIQETKAVFEPLREKLLAAVAGLEQLLVSCGILYGCIVAELYVCVL